MICSGRFLVYLLALLVVAAPAHAEGDEGPEPAEDDSTASQDTSGNTTSTSDDTNGSQNTADATTVQDPDDDADSGPCGIVYWHQSDPDRVIIDPNNCFTPAIYELITST